MSAPSRSLPEQFTMRPLAIEHDAEKLAAMWNASDAEWPGTWTRGLPYTAQAARDWEAHQQPLETLVCDTGTTIAGYCAWWAKPDEPSASYIAYVNVAPQFQGLGLARSMLSYFVDKASARGDLRLDLGTWSGNLKAVPLYKRCGFCWVPGTSVRMQNYLPAIVNLPCAKPFFARNSWYATLQRPLNQAEDDERWEGMGIYTYRFVAPAAQGRESGRETGRRGDRESLITASTSLIHASSSPTLSGSSSANETLVARVDRESRRITAVETAAFAAAAIVADQEPPRGLPAPIRWRVENRGDKPLALSLIASGSEDLRLDFRRSLTIEPGATIELSAEIAVAAQKPLVEGGPALVIRSLLVLDGELLELNTGLRPRSAIELRSLPSRISLAPGVAQEVELVLRSRVKRDLTATVRLSPAPGLSADWSARAVGLPAGQRMGLRVRLLAERAGVYELPMAISFSPTEAIESIAGVEQPAVRAAAEPVRLPTKQLRAFALAPGGLLGGRDDDDLRLENETMRVEIEPRGASLSIYDMASGRWLATHGGYAVPPQRPSEFAEGKWDLSLEREADALIAVARFAAKQRPGLVLYKRVRFSAGPLLSIAYQLENQGDTPYTLQLHQWLSTDDEESITTMPLRNGIVRDRSVDVPDGTRDSFNMPENFAEPWVALEFPYATLGAIWGDDLAEVKWSMLTSRDYELAPGAWLSPRPLHIYVGAGDWRTVQRVWQRLAGQPAKRNTPELAARPQLSARFVGGSALLAGERGTATLLIERLLQRPVSGTARLLLPAGWQADQTEFTLDRLDWQNPLRAELKLVAQGAPGPASAQLAISTDERDELISLPLIKLGSGGPVTIHEHASGDQPVLTIDNGRMALDVTPGFAGTISALRTGGINQLATPFPQAGAIGWMSPWYGGVAPLLCDPENGAWLPGALHRERFSFEELRLTAGGLNWAGLRQRAELVGKGLRGLVLELDALTLGGSPLVQLTMRLHNPTAASRRTGMAGWLVYAAPAGSRTPTIWGAEGRQIKHGNRAPWLHTGHWAAAADPLSGQALALIAPLPLVGAAGFSPAGNALRLFSELEVPAGAAVTIVAYLALAANMDEVRGYAALAESEADISR